LSIRICRQDKREIGFLYAEFFSNAFTLLFISCRRSTESRSTGTWCVLHDNRRWAAGMIPDHRVIAIAPHGGQP
jgi:hypothetical protein